MERRSFLQRLGLLGLGTGIAKIAPPDTAPALPPVLPAAPVQFSSASTLPGFTVAWGGHGTPLGMQRFRGWYIYDGSYDETETF